MFACSAVPPRPLSSQPLFFCRSQIASIFFGGRYIILLMGIFSMYTGLIYNDIFSKSLNIFGSAWRVGFSEDFINATDVETMGLMPENKTMYRGDPYPFGFDPVWQITENKVTYQNAFKMKLSVLLGVAQMVFGVMLSIFNYV